MKKLLYILVLITGFANAQIVSIPDPNFKNILVNTNCVDTNPSYFDNVGEQSVDTSGDGEIQLSEALAVTNLLLNNQSLTSLNGIENFINLKYLTCNFNPLGTLDLSALINLESLSCSSCQLTSLNVNGLYNLQGVTCQSNLLTSLNLGNTHVYGVNANNNPNLTYVSLKNGVVSTCMYLIGMPDACITFNSCPLLETICVDDDELVFQSFFTATLTSYCTFTPGGDYNTITGTIRYDTDNDGCDINDSVPPNVKVKLLTLSDIAYSFTNTLGAYTFYTGIDSFGWFLDIENPTFFNVSPEGGETEFGDINNNVVNQDFCVSANGIHSDVEMVIAPIIPARPGFDAVYNLAYKNKGNKIETLSLNFNYDDSKLEYVASSATPNVSSVDGHYQWQVFNVLPFQSGSVQVKLHVNTPPVTLGDVLTFTSFVDVTSDENWSDNSFTYNQTVVSSFDPNDITCIEGSMVSPAEIGNYLHYIINFENTGTADAENVVVKDIIDSEQFDYNSLQIVDSSNPVTARINGNVCEFIFPNINLHSGGHGNILIKVKSRSNLVQGDTVSKRANIYFDYNAPVETNLENTIFQALSNSGFEIDASISVYPNPTKGNLNINCNNNINSVQLFDVQGRLLQTNLVNETQTRIDISDKSKGVYFLKVLSDKGIKVEKIVRE